MHSEIRGSVRIYSTFRRGWEKNVGTAKTKQQQKREFKSDTEYQFFNQIFIDPLPSIGSRMTAAAASDPAALLRQLEMAAQILLVINVSRNIMVFSVGLSLSVRKGSHDA